MEGTPSGLLRHGWNVDEGDVFEPKDVIEREAPLDVIPRFITERIVNSWLKHHGLFSHLIESHNEMMRMYVPYMIYEHGVIAIASERCQELHIVLVRPPNETRKPHKHDGYCYLSDLSVREARDRSMTYEATVHISYEHFIYKPRKGAKPIRLFRRLPRSGAGAGAGGEEAGAIDPSPRAVSIMCSYPDPTELVDEADPRPEDEDAEIPDSIRALIGLQKRFFAYADEAKGAEEDDSEDETEESPEGGDAVIPQSALQSLDDMTTSRLSMRSGVRVNMRRFECVQHMVNENATHLMIPTMVGSESCHSKDAHVVAGEPWTRAKGYYVINGQEKVIIPQLNPVMNLPFVFRSLKHGVQVVTAEMRPRHRAKIRSSSTITVTLTSGERGTGIVSSSVKLPYVKKTIPLVLFCRLIGFESVTSAARVFATGGRVDGEDVARVPTRPECAVMENWIRDVLETSLRDAPDTFTMSSQQLIESVSRTYLQNEARCTREARKNVDHTLSNEFMPHVGLDARPLTMKHKRAVFSALVWRACAVARGELAPDDRDFLGNMMVELPGMLIMKLLRQHYRHAMKRVVKLMTDWIDEMKPFVVGDVISLVRQHTFGGLHFALSTGVWGIEKGGARGHSVQGVAQVFKRDNPHSSLSLLRCMRKPGNTKDTAPRQLRVHEWGLVCPSEVSEGENCGLLKHMALLTHISQGYPTRMLVDAIFRFHRDEICFVRDFPDKLETEGSVFRQSLLFVNGVPLGSVENGSAFARKLRRLRVNGHLPPDVSVAFMPTVEEVHVHGENGIMSRLLFVLDDSEQPSPERVRASIRRIRELGETHDGRDGELFNRLFAEGLLAYVSKHEEASLVIRADPHVLHDDEETPYLRHWGGAHMEELEAMLEEISVEEREDKTLSSEPVVFMERTSDKKGGDPPSRSLMLRAIQSIEREESAEEFVNREAKHGSLEAKRVCALKRPENRLRAAEKLRSILAGEEEASAKSSTPRKPSKRGRDGESVGAGTGTSEEVASARAHWRRMRDLRARRMALEASYGLGADADAVAAALASHSEVHPMAIHSALIAMIPFSSHNQAPRNTYQAAMAKGSIATPLEADESRTAAQLDEAQVPLVQTSAERMLGPTVMRNGRNVVVAVMTLDGYNQEDSLYVNRGAIDMGLFWSSHTQVYSEGADNPGGKGDVQTFERPDESVFGKRDANYDKLNEYGYVDPGTIVHPGDVVIGKTVEVVDLQDAADKTAYHSIGVSSSPFRGGTSARQAEAPTTKETPRSTASTTAKKGALSSLFRMQAPTAAKAPASASPASSTSATPSASRAPSMAHVSKPMTRVQKRDQSCYLRDTDPSGNVRNVTLTYGRKNKRRVQIGYVDVLDRGDKLSARHGQKGVVGEKIPRENMPFGVLRVPVRDEDGKVVRFRDTPLNVDIIINPHALPSRMTVGMLIEMVFGTAAALGGYIVDGTSFNRTITPDQIQEELRKLGLSHSGRMQLYSGTTGEPLGNGGVFVGVAYYQRLKQLAADKARALDRGRRSALTRQPMEGKRGGLRLGEMERDALIAHGAAQVVVDSFLHRSDDYITTACTKCGLFAVPPRKTDERLAHITGLRDQIGFCTACKTSEHVSRVRLPYALKLFMQELMAMGIAPRMKIRASSLHDFASAASAGVAADETSIPKLEASDVALAEDEAEEVTERPTQRKRVRKIVEEPVRPRGGGGGVPGGVTTRGPDVAEGLDIQYDPEYGV